MLDTENPWRSNEYPIP